MDKSAAGRLPIGVPGLDEVLRGGVLPSRTYLVRGGPGVGKTLLGLHFLVAGSTSNERGLFITMAEPEAKVRQTAESIGLDLKNVQILDLSPGGDIFSQLKAYDIFTPADVERDPMTRAIVDRIESLKPQRVYVDALTQFRYLTTDRGQFRRQVLSFLHYLMDKGATVLFSSESSEQDPDDDMQFMSDGIFTLSQVSDRRFLSVTKFRGSDFLSGSHSMRISRNGLAVFPRLVAEAYRKFEFDLLSSGVVGLDALLRGGIERATITLVTGPSGAGKTTLALQFIHEAAARGGRSLLYSFEEELDILLRRADGIGLPARTLRERGGLAVERVDPRQYTADEFARVVRNQVDEQQARLLVVDSVGGYRQAMGLGHGEEIPHLATLSKAMQRIGVTVFLIHDAEVGGNRLDALTTGLSYLSDNIVFLRYFEGTVDGIPELRKGIGCLKKRMSDFGRSMCELAITPDGLWVGPPIQGLRGIFDGAAWKEEPRRPSIWSKLLGTGR